MRIRVSPWEVYEFEERRMQFPAREGPRCSFARFPIVLQTKGDLPFTVTIYYTGGY